jgi:uncharacterized protein YbjT (DUF2867 family)
MTEDRTAHERHRPPGPPPTEFEAFHPTGDIVAAAQDRNQAESVVQALTSLGVPATDMDILDPAFVIQAAEELERRRGILGRLGALFGDDNYFAAQFVELALKGHPLLLIHVSDRETATRVGTTLKNHGVRIGSYYGRMTITDL